MIPFVISTRKTAEKEHISIHKNKSEIIQTPFAKSAEYVRKTPMMRYLIYITAIMWLVSWFVDYQFFSVLEKSIKNGSLHPFVGKSLSFQDQIASFLGSFYSMIYIGGIFLEIFIVRKLLRRGGVKRGLLIHPLVVMISSSGLILRGFHIFPAINNYFTTMVKYMDETLLNSSGESSFHLLFNAIPEQFRSQCRIFIIGFIEPLAAIVAGFILILLINQPISFLSILTWLLCVLWVYFIIKVGHAYVHAMLSQLADRSNKLDLSTISYLTQLKDANFSEILEALILSKN